MADMFLTLPGIKGESKDPAFAGTMELAWANWGMNLPGSSDGRLGPSQADEIVVSKPVDSTSPLLLKALNSPPMTNGRISFRQPGPDPTTSPVFLIIDLVDVVVRRVVVQSTREDYRPIEEVSLEFREATWTYRRRNADGSDTVLSSFRWVSVQVA
jgi:type VI protein secretion system component Hcp